MPRNRPAISSDGYISLPISRLETIRLFHLISGLDENFANADSRLTAITGYTEWISNTAPMITLGWDWQLAPIVDQVSIRRIGKRRGNIMLRENKMDAGQAKTLALVESLIDSLDWEKAVRDCIDLRCSG